MALRLRLRRRLASEARRAAGLLLRVAQQAEPAPIAAGRGGPGGPPEHWLAVVRARAPQLLDGRGIGVRAERGPARGAGAEPHLSPAEAVPADGEGPTSSAAGTGVRARPSGGHHWPAAAEPAGAEPSWPPLPSSPAAAGTWAELPRSAPPPPGWTVPAPADAPRRAWPAPAAPGGPAPATWPVPPSPAPSPRWEPDPAPTRGGGGEAQTFPAAGASTDLGPQWPSAAGSAPMAAAAGPDPARRRRGGPHWTTPSSRHRAPVGDAGGDLTGRWPSLPVAGEVAPVPAHGAFDRDRVDRLDAEQRNR